VRSSALATSIPLDPRGAAELGFELQGGELAPPGQNPKTDALLATPGYIETLGVSLVRGRDLRWADAQSAPRVVLVNEAFVRRYLPGEPLGRRIIGLLGPPTPGWEIVGVIGDVRSRGLDRAPVPLVVIPLLQFPRPQLRLAVRAAGADPLQLVSLIRSELAALDKDVPLSAPQSLAKVVNESVGERRFQATLLSVFALLALALAALGIYGVMAWTVAQRSREIGIRMALGARKGDVLQWILAKGGRLIGFGLAVGMPGGVALSSYLSSLLVGLSPSDPVTFVCVSFFLGAVALLACYVPARRAAKVDPMVALRYE